MSSLQIGLAVAGGLVLAGLVAHGAWTARRNAPRQASPEQPPREPTLGESALSGFDTDSAPVLGDAPPLGIPGMDKQPPLDALLDAVAPIVLETVVSGDAALLVMPTTRRAGSKPFFVEGLNQVTHEWEPPALGQRYEAFQAGVQLANRTGPLNEIEYSEFVVKAQTFADAVNGTAQFPEMLDEVARARELDQFASEHDAQLSFTLQAHAVAWSPGYVQQNAAHMGFVVGAMPGRMVLPASSVGLPPVLTLSFDPQAALAEDPAQAAVRELTLALDVAQVARSERAFVRMREAARDLAKAMDGVVTDDKGQPLAWDDMDVIGYELETLYDTLDARDLASGSVLARRLFS
ncbi:MAG: cell division protein FtsZ [Rhodoferax sp.]|nr:cell division protein FtsZ [Rhodoferax sp.]